MINQSLAMLKRPGLLACLAILITALAVACSTSAEPTAAPTVPQFSAQAIPAATAVPAPEAAAPATDSGSGAASAPAPAAAPTAAPQPTVPPPAPVAGRDTAIVVTEAEPASVGAWSEGCSAEIHSLGCQDFVSDFLTWLDDRTSEIVPLSGVESWEQQGLDRWRFFLRDGVTFHNGAPWNAAAAKYGVEYNANVANPSASISWTGPDVKGEVVDDLTVDIVCPVACPIYPRTALFADFQDPAWFEAADESERSRLTVGFGPYKIIEYNPGVDTKFEAFEDYKPNENWFSQAPSIQYITHTYRAEATVRASMIQTGEADWAADIGFDEIVRVPKHTSGKTAEVYTLVLDTVFHPELKKQKVREALAIAIDCQSLLDSLFDGRIPCHAAISMKGTVGINDENSKVREYDPERAKELLAEAGYDPANAINVNTRPGSNIRGLELMESTVTFWRDIGVTSELNSWSDLGKAREVQISGCGRFIDEPGYKEAMDCGSREPPGPYFQTSHAYEIATSNEILDMQRFNNSRLSCFSRSSRVCIPEFEARKLKANAIPEGPERTRAMEDLAQFAYDEVFFIPYFEVVYVYGLSEDMEWEAYYAPRLRGNTMRFSQ